MTSAFASYWPLSSKATQPIPARLEALVMKCLAKEPAERPRDADGLSVELGACIEGAPWSPAEAGTWWEKNLEGR